MNQSIHEFLKNLDAYIEEIEFISEQVIKLKIYAPLAAKNFKPGQFFRLQTYEGSLAYPMKALALTGAYVEGDFVTLIVHKVGRSTSLCGVLKKGERVSLMGPTGLPTFIPQEKNVLLIGGGIGNACLFPIAQKMKENRCYIHYFSGYRTFKEKCYDTLIEKNVDHIVWCVDEKKNFISHRTDDHFFNGSPAEALFEFKSILKDIDHVLVVGSAGLMKAVAKVCRELESYFKDTCVKIASLNNPMQCMMKEVCAKCLQKHKDPVTGEDFFIYSCVQQDQDLMTIDFDFLTNRHLAY